MGRLESLTAMALGRGAYDDEVVDTGPRDPNGPQRYDSKGRPRNSQTRRREKDQVRAANEVMQVTGIVEDSSAAKSKATQSTLDRTHETITGLRLMDAGKAVLVAGVWGVVGLRRRILLYRPYAETTILHCIRQERAVCGIPRMLSEGLPAMVACHAFEWTSFVFESLLAAYYDEEGDTELTKREVSMKWGLDVVREIIFSFAALHCRLFSTVQQLHLVPTGRWFPSLLSFIPFSSASPLTLQPLAALPAGSIASFGAANFGTCSPFLILLAHESVKRIIGHIIYPPIYRTLPRPVGESMFSGLRMAAPTGEYDTPDHATAPEDHPSARNHSDEPTLRALEGLPATDPAPTTTVEEESEDDGEPAQATLISFDVEDSEPVESLQGPWSAELRSANEPPSSSFRKPFYRVTGLTMLPPILAAQGLKEIAASIVALPFEACMVREIGRAFRASAGVGADDLWMVGPGVYGVGNLLAVLTAQLAVTGVLWAGFTFGAHMLATKRRERKGGDEGDE